MRYDKNNPKYKKHKVELNGVIQPNAVEADDQEGWVTIEIEHEGWGTWIERKTLYGRVFIVRFEGFDEDAVQEESEEENE